MRTDMVIYTHTERIRSMRKETPQDRYKKKNIKQVKLDLNINTEQDIIEWLNKQPNKQGTIKQLIRREIEKEV